jgi:pyridoxamine 5'-phosphate oxidase
VVSGRAELDRLQSHVEDQFGGRTDDEGGEIPLPPHWGGWRIEPVTVEFWQGRTGRMHDRLRYRLISDQSLDDRWVIERLAP